MGVLSLTQYENITTYYGVRFGYINTLNKNEYNFLTREGISKNTQNGYYIAPVGGAEYLLQNALVSVRKSVLIIPIQMEMKTPMTVIIILHLKVSW